MNPTPTSQNSADQESTSKAPANQAQQPDEPEFFTIRQASELLGIKTGTLRHYCNLGLIPGLRRNRTGYRIFSHAQLDQLRNIACLFRCELTSREIKNYLRSSPAKQKRILSTKKQQLWQKLDDIRQNIDFIERQEDLLTQSQTLQSL